MTRNLELKEAPKAVMPREISPLYTYDEAAAYIRKSVTYLREQVHKESLSIKRIGRTPYFTKEELDRFIDAAPTETGKAAQRARHNRKSA